MTNEQYFAHCRAEARAAAGNALDAPEHIVTGAHRKSDHLPYPVCDRIVRDGDTIVHCPRIFWTEVTD